RRQPRSKSKIRRHLRLPAPQMGLFEHVRTLHLVERWDMVTTTIMPSATKTKLPASHRRDHQKNPNIFRKNPRTSFQKSGPQSKREEPLRAEVYPAGPRMRLGPALFL